jgi:hypothetical protein
VRRPPERGSLTEQDRLQSDQVLVDQTGVGKGGGELAAAEEPDCAALSLLQSWDEALCPFADKRHSLVRRDVSSRGEDEDLLAFEDSIASLKRKGHFVG